jgi:hypothetical protein
MYYVYVRTHARSLALYLLGDSSQLGASGALCCCSSCLVVVVCCLLLLLLLLGLLFLLGVCCCCGCCVRVLVVVGGCCCRGWLLAICVLTFTRRSTSSCLVGQSWIIVSYLAPLFTLPVSSPVYRPRLSRVLEPSPLPLIITRFIHGPPINLGYGTAVYGI